MPREGFALDLIRSGGLKGKSIGAIGCAARLLLPLGLLDAWRIVSARRPHLVIGVGGYSSGPVVLVAALRGVPTMLLEQNAVPGLTNRLLARVVRRGGGDVRLDAGVFRREGVRQRQPGAAGVPRAVGRSTGVATRRSDAAGVGSWSLAALRARTRSTWPWWRQRRSWRPRSASSISPPDGRARCGDGARRLSSGAGLQADVEPFLYDMGRRARRGGRDRLPRRRDDAGGAHGGGQGRRF